MSLVLQDQLVLSPATADHLQEEIDAIEAGSDVTDVVGTYEDLENYDTSALTDKDVIKVLDDETRNHAQTYYRWSTSAREFSYVGQIAKPAVDSVNGKTGDVVLNATDVSALPITGGTMTGDIITTTAVPIKIRSGGNGAVLWQNESGTKDLGSIYPLGNGGLQFYGGSIQTKDVRLNNGILYPGTNNDGKLGDANYKWSYVYTNKINNGEDIVVPNAAGTMALMSDVDTKVSKTDTASQVYGTDANGAQTTYNKDDFGQVDDVQVNGVSVVTNKIANVTVPDPLPSQSGNAGKFLTTDGTDASWSDKPLVNTATRTESLGILGTAITGSSVVLGYNASDGSASGGGSAKVVVGNSASATGNGATAIGQNAKANNMESIAIGNGATASANGAVQIKYGTNSTANTLQFGSYQIVSADGTIPEARLADTTSATEGQVLQLDSNNNAIWADVDSLPDQTSQAGKILGTDGTNAAWETKTTVSFRTWGANE